MRQQSIFFILYLKLLIKQLINNNNNTYYFHRIVIDLTLNQYHACMIKRGENLFSTFYIGSGLKQLSL